MRLLKSGCGGSKCDLALSCSGGCVVGVAMVAEARATGLLDKTEAVIAAVAMVTDTNANGRLDAEIGARQLRGLWVAGVVIRFAVTVLAVVCAT